jgi:ferredoxin
MPVGREVAERALDAAVCIGCGACVAACPNGSAALFVGAKLAHLGLLPQGQPERTRRARALVAAADVEGFGACTLHGECEVYPDKPCVWVRIHQRTVSDALTCPHLLPSPDARLYNTSSYLNSLAGRDQPARQPLPYLDLGRHRTTLPVQTASRLERRLKSGAFVRTCEVRAPRAAVFDRFREQALLVRDHFDAVNATAYLNGKPSLPSSVAAAELGKLGIEAVCQATCRDHTKTSIIAELLHNQMNGVHNTLCLTGDSYAAIPKIKQVFDMDGALMLYEARHLRETGVVHFTGEPCATPRPFLGAAINPLTNPVNVPSAAQTEGGRRGFHPDADHFRRGRVRPVHGTGPAGTNRRRCVHSGGCAGDHVARGSFRAAAHSRHQLARSDPEPSHAG